MPGHAANPTEGLRSIRIERRGGFAGLKPVVELEAATLTAEQRQALAAVLKEAAPLPHSPAPARGIPAAADRFSYRITTTGADGASTVRAVGESQMPDALARLCRPTGS